MILEEIRQGSDDPARSVAQSLFATAYVAHPYRRPVIGTAEQRAAPRRARPRRVLSQLLRRGQHDDRRRRATSTRRRARRDIERRFRAMPAGAARSDAGRARAGADLAASGGSALRDVSEAYVAVGGFRRVPAARHPDVAALDVAAILLGESESARLPRVLRDDEQIVTTAYAHVHALRDPGLFVLSATSARPMRAGPSVRWSIRRSRSSTTSHPTSSIRRGSPRKPGYCVSSRPHRDARARSAGTPPSRERSRDSRTSTSIGSARCAATMSPPPCAATAGPENATVSAVLPKQRARKLGGAAFARDAEKRVRAALKRAPAAPSVADRRVTLGNGMVLIVRRGSVGADRGDPRGLARRPARGR